VTSARRVASRRKAARGGSCGTGGLDRADAEGNHTYRWPQAARRLILVGHDAKHDESYESRQRWL